MLKRLPTELQQQLNPPVISQLDRIHWQGMVVVEQESSLYPGDWVSVNREWQGPAVPVPTTLLLFGSGLVGLVGFRKKFKK